MDMDLLEKFTERALKQIKRGETHNYVFVPGDKSGDHVLIVNPQYRGEVLLKKVWDAMKKADEEDDNVKRKSFWGSARKGRSSRLLLETNDPPSKAKQWAKELLAEDARVDRAGFQKVVILKAGEEEPLLEAGEEDDEDAENDAG